MFTISTGPLIFFPGMPNLQVLTLGLDGNINSFGMDIDSNIDIPKLPSMDFKHHAHHHVSHRAQYFAINYRNILYFISTSPFAKVTRSEFLMGNWSFYQIPNTKIPTFHMANAIGVPINKFLWVVGGIKPYYNLDGFSEGIYTQ